MVMGIVYEGSIVLSQDVKMHRMPYNVFEVVVSATAYVLKRCAVIGTLLVDEPSLFFYRLPIKSVFTKCLACETKPARQSLLTVK